jgi:hypothetical protein
LLEEEKNYRITILENKGKKGELEIIWGTEKMILLPLNWLTDHLVRGREEEQNNHS